MLAKIMLIRLLEHVVDLVLPEYQYVLRRGHSTMDIIFVARKLQEKCREQHKDLYMAFVDLPMAYIQALMQSTETFLGTFFANLAALPLFAQICLPSTFCVSLQFHTGMCAQVVCPPTFCCHTTTIPNRHLCSSCHDWLSVLQLSC